MTRLTGDWMRRPETVAVLDALERAGHAAYFVGGCVRDALAGLPVKDIDIATDARPERVMDLAHAAGLKPVPTGVDHGTVTVVSGDLPHEVTTFRRDVETDGRRAVVDYSDDIVEDALRRDLTINALYAERDGTVVDPLGSGVADLAAGRVRFVGDAAERIREDYLRILRYFRFLARFGADGPDPDALAAIGENLGGIETLSAERLGHEMRSLLSLGNPAPAVAIMAGAGVLGRVLPGAEATWLPVLVHLETETGTAPDAIRRLAAIGGHGAEDRLRLSRAEARRLARLCEVIGSDRGIAEIAYREGFEAARDAALLRGALGGDGLQPGALEKARSGADARFPVAAADLMPELAGPALGEKLRALEARWIESGFRLKRDDLLKD